jgi:hypothetical protein
MIEKKWPLTQEPTCVAKWNWSTIYMTNSASSSCHRTTQYKFNLDNFDDFHNLPEKLRDRQLMLDGQWPGNGCEYCKKIEDAGGTSDRMWNNANNRAVPMEIFKDSTATNIVPPMVEVYFDNTCDLKCAYCGPWYSSAWAAENKKHGYFKYDRFELTDKYQASPDRRAYVEKFWLWWDKHYDKVEHFQFLGGEPFYQKEFDEFVEFVGNHRNPKLMINITSNLNCDTDRLKEKIEKFKQFKDDGRIKTLQIVGSIDCWGPQQEFLRFPLDLDRWERNFEYLVSQEWIVLNINSAVNALSIKTMPDLFRKLNGWRQRRPVYQYFMTVQEPHPLCPDYMGTGVFTQDFQDTIKLMEETTHLDDWYENFIPYMTGISKQVDATTVNVAKLRELNAYLDELDRRRKTDWKSLFPWVVDLFDKHNV